MGATTLVGSFLQKKQNPAYCFFKQENDRDRCNAPFAVNRANRICFQIHPDNDTSGMLAGGSVHCEQQRNFEVFYILNGVISKIFALASK